MDPNYNPIKKLIYLDKKENNLSDKEEDNYVTEEGFEDLEEDEDEGYYEL
jgi:hypothetical protein